METSVNLLLSNLLVYTGIMLVIFFIINVGVILNNKNKKECPGEKNWDRTILKKVNLGIGVMWLIGVVALLIYM